MSNLKFLPLLFLPLLFLLLPTPAQAAHCAYDTVGETVTVTTATPVNVDLFLDTVFGTTQFQSIQLEFCVGEDDGGGNVTVEFLTTAGVVLNTQSAANNTHYTWTPNTTYIGPVRIRVTDTGAAQATSNYFMFIAPPPPTQATNCTGPQNSCFAFYSLPSYAIGGQVYNPVFNSFLSDLSTIPTNGAYPNTVLQESGFRSSLIPGIYAGDTTYISTTSYVIFYWWLKAGPEGFPDWSVRFENEVKGVVGDVIDLEALSEQFRTFTPDSNYFGYVVLLADNAAASFLSTGWWDQIDSSLVGGTDPSQFYGVWKPVNLGSYGDGSVIMPEGLNGGYLFLVESAGEGLLSGTVLTVSSGLLKTADFLLSGEVDFYPRTGASSINYLAELRDYSGQQLLSSMEIANTDGVSTSRVPFSFYAVGYRPDGKVVIREETDPKYPAVVVPFTSKSILVRIIPLAAFQGLSSFVNSVSGTSFSQILTQGTTAYGTNAVIGGLLLSLIPTLLTATWLLVKTKSIVVASLVSVLLLVLFMFLGLLPPAWLLLPLWFLLGFGVGWKVIVERGPS